MLSKFKAFVKKEVTLCIAFLAAAISMLIVPPDAAYWGYMDWRTLALLYALMVVVAGLTNAGVFSTMAHVLCVRASSVRAMGAVLVGLCFVTSLFLTNDVTLLTFVPFAVVVLSMAGEMKSLAWVVVLQTAAANVGSCLTPIGNPQNMYLHSHFNMTMGEFFSATAPTWCFSAVLLAVLCCVILPKKKLSVFLGEAPGLDKKALTLYLVLFLVCMLVVFRVLTWPVMLGVLVAVLLVLDRKALLRADFLLLVTFVCFFIFSGNLRRMDAVAQVLQSLLQGHEMVVGAAVSQVISNVPAAILLSGFTDNAKALLLGVNIGGLGTPIASLASLISLKLYAQSEGADSRGYMGKFLAVNFGLLGILLALGALLQ